MNPKEFLKNIGAKLVELDVAETADLMICGRVSPGETVETHQIPGSRQENCSICSHLVWVSPTSPQTVKRVCIPCGIRLLKQQKTPVTFATTAAQQEELRKYMEKDPL